MTFHILHNTHTQIEKQINELPSLSSSPESETDWFPSSTAQIPQKGIIQWLRDVATIPYPSGKNWVSDLVGAKSSTPGPRDVEENTRCLPLSKSPGNRLVSKVVQEHFQFKEIIANKSRTWKFSNVKINPSALFQTTWCSKLLKQHIPNFLVILPPHDVAVNAHPHPT